MIYLAYTVSTKDTDSDESDFLQTAMDRLVKIEFITGIVGTLIWGFGDLVL